MIIAVEATLAQGPATGLGVYVRNLIRELARQAPEHTFLLLHASRRWTGPDFGPNCRPVSYWCGKQSLAIHLRLNAVLRRERAELFHATGTTGAPPACAVPVVSTVHDLYPLAEPQHCRPAFRFFFKYLWGWSLRSSQRFIAVSGFTAAEMQRLSGVPAGRITVVPIAADSTEAPDAAPLPAGLESGYFLCLGAVEPRKGQTALADAYAEFLRTAPPDSPRLVFAGPDRGAGATLAARLRTPQLAGRALWLGAVDNAAREALYRNARAFLFPSSYEGFGIPVLEAMRRQLPVLCSDIPVLREVAGDAALFAPPGDATGWSTAMRRLAAEPELSARLRADGPIRAAAFTWAECARRTLAVYAAVAEQGRTEK
jgi:glycosyltransferase involved in cell wall biosynthesis